MLELCAYQFVIFVHGERYKMGALHVFLAPSDTALKASQHAFYFFLRRP